MGVCVWNGTRYVSRSGICWVWMDGWVEWVRVGWWGYPDPASQRPFPHLPPTLTTTAYEHFHCRPGGPEGRRMDEGGNGVLGGASGQGKARTIGRTAPTPGATPSRTWSTPAPTSARPTPTPPSAPVQAGCACARSLHSPGGWMGGPSPQPFTPQPNTPSLPTPPPTHPGPHCVGGGLDHRRTDGDAATTPPHHPPHKSFPPDYPRP